MVFFECECRNDQQYRTGHSCGRGNSEHHRGFGTISCHNAVDGDAGYVDLDFRGGHIRKGRFGGQIQISSRHVGGNFRAREAADRRHLGRSIGRERKAHRISTGTTGCECGAAIDNGL